MANAWMRISRSGRGRAWTICSEAASWSYGITAGRVADQMVQLRASTFRVLARSVLSYFPAKKSIVRSIKVDAIVIPFFVSESLMFAFITVVRKPFAR